MTQDEIIEMAQECGLIGMRPHLDGIYSEALVAFAKLVAEKALKDHAMSEVQRLGQEIEQEPVAWVSEDVCDGQYIDGRPRKIWWECNKGVGTAFYTTPPQRTWVNLTDEDRNDCLVEADPCECLATPEAQELMRCVEAKSKELNHGK